ncbi:uncharacterized protein LOC110849016 [Folsomia candida]|uniref:Zinc finger CCCH domain-containing protein 7A n=1 Tax=Folsomia candida TaxID=158441 RepID=A0A226F3L4_FOLCA|nr:uncharacterized protein LOC110849016 [Folsomia candida]OXA64385.1 Zinc finger CCCH domain-containing protein 7A [Folsomia candida]
MDSTSILLGCKSVGNTAFAQRNYGKAIRTYTQGLTLLPSNIDLLSNRAAAYLNYGLYSLALHDAETVLSTDPTHEKCLYRKVKALWGLSRYHKAHQFTEKFKIPSLADKAAITLSQSLGHIKASTLMSLPHQARHEIADYRGPIEIVPIPGKGRGIVATENIPVGSLIICSKAFCIVFDQDVQDFKNFHLRDKSVELEHTDALGGLIYDKLQLDPSLKSELLKLYTGQQESQSSDDITLTIRNIIDYNGFTSKRDDSLISMGNPNFAGLWILPSYLNHSCLDNNANYAVYGDILVVRAVKNIPKGDEILISYWQATVPGRREVMKARNFECGCRACKMEDEEDPLIKAEIAQLLQQIRESLVSPSSDLPATTNRNFDRVQRIVKLRKKKYGDTNMALLTPEVEMVGAALSERHDTKGCIFILENMHKVCKNNGFVLSSVYQAMNLSSHWRQMNKVEEWIEWAEQFRKNVIAACGDFDDGLIALKIDPECSAIQAQTDR